MSQYTISLQSIINIKSHNPPLNDDVFANVRKKIERGREIFFNFDYAGDAEFKELFERGFLIKNIDENIYINDADLFMLALENDVKRRAPLYYKRYKIITELSDEELTLADITLTEGSSERRVNEQRSDSASAQTSGSSKAKGKSASSDFPQDIETAADFSAIKYMDAGNATENENESSSSSTTSGSGKTEHSDSANDKHTTKRTISKIERAELYMRLQLDVIDEFINTFNNLFMLIW